ncbi:ankyrin repeat domain-containing protein 34C [Amia ocellicauda]|uniref:ankyrin repeat domain-containing protein 34C n=1 Tax=Amia ocellicauda TaxID=2972642 RepID=UPI0034649C22
MGEPREYLSDGSPLIQAAQLGRLRLVRLLVEGGAQVNERNQRGETALAAACRGTRPLPERLKLLRFLLEHAADPNAQDKAGRTALMYACMEKAGPEVSALLLEHGADPGLEDYGGASALVYAVNAREPTTLQVLLDGCRQRGRDILIIASRLGSSGHPVTKRYLNAPPSPDYEGGCEGGRCSSPVSCMSPSEIELKTSSPGSPGSEGDNIFSFRGASKRGSVENELLPPDWNPPHGRRLRSEPWLAIRNLSHLRSAYEESLRRGSRQEEEEGDPGEGGDLSADLEGLAVSRRASVCQLLDSTAAERAQPLGAGGRQVSRKPSFEKLPPSTKTLLPDRRNTLPTVQPSGDPLRLPSLVLDPCPPDSHCQISQLSPGWKGHASSSPNWRSSSLESSDWQAMEPSSARPFLPPLPAGPSLLYSPAPPQMPLPCPSPRPLLCSSKAVGGRRGAMQRRHSIQAEQLKHMGGYDEILIL